MSSPDFVTVDVFDRPPGGRMRWRRDLKRTLGGDIAGLRGASVNFANDGARSLVPHVVPGGVALVAAWESAEAAEAAFAGPLRKAIDGPGRFSLDSELVRVRVDGADQADDGGPGNDESFTSNEIVFFGLDDFRFAFDD